MEAGIARISARVASRYAEETIDAWHDKVARRVKVEGLRINAEHRVKVWRRRKVVEGWRGFAKVRTQSLPHPEPHGEDSKPFLSKGEDSKPA